MLCTRWRPVPAREPTMDPATDGRSPLSEHEALCVRAKSLKARFDENNYKTIGGVGGRRFAVDQHLPSTAVSENGESRAERTEFVFMWNWSL